MLEFILYENIFKLSGEYVVDFLMDIKQRYRIHHPEFGMGGYSSDDITHHYLDMEIYYRLIKTLAVLQMDFSVRNANHNELPPINVFEKWEYDNLPWRMLSPII